MGRIWIRNSVDAFLRLCVKDPNSECVLWAGSKNRHGYGRLWWHGRERRASQVAWEIAHERPFPDGLEAMHSCDNPPCVNSDHVTPATTLQNQADKVLKGRQPQGDSHYTRIEPLAVVRGERHGMARLTEAAVRDIRSNFVTGKDRRQEWAEKYGVSAAMIWRVLRGKAWVHVH